MQARYDLFNKLCRLKSEMEVLIKNVVSYKNSKGFNPKMNQLVSEFDIALKQVPKTIAFRQDQKPIALQEFLTNFQKKVNHRKENLLNRYIREIEQIKAQFNKISKQSTAKSIEFIEDTQHYEQRFKRQLNIRKNMNKESIESLKKHQKERVNSKEIEEQYNQIRIEEENRIIQRRKNELETLQLQIDHLKQELNEALVSDNDNLIEKRKESNIQKIEILKNQKNDEIELIKKQINDTQSNIQSVTDRISSLKQSQLDMKNNFQSIINQISSQSKTKTDLRINQIKEEIKIIESQISSLQNKMQSPIVPLNKESFDLELKKELNEREEKLKNEEKKKRIEWEEQILSKINQHHSILKEIYQIESQTEILNEKVEAENKNRTENSRKENQKEIDEINDELLKMRKNYLNLAKSQNKGELIHLQTELTDINLKMYQIEKEKNDFESNKSFQKLKNKEDLKDEFVDDEFYSIFESFTQKEINNNNKIQLIIEKLNGQLNELQQASNDYIDSFNQLLIEKVEQNCFELKVAIELKEKEIYLNQITQDNEELFKVENESNNLFLSVDSLFNIIDEFDLKIDENEEVDRTEKDRLKKLLTELKEKQKIGLNKLHSIVNELNQQRNDFSLSLNDEFKSEIIEKVKNEDETILNLQMKKIDLLKKAENEINEVKQNCSKENEDDLNVLSFLKRKELEDYYSSIIEIVKENNQIKEDLMKQKIKMAKREMMNEEKEEEVIYWLKKEIFDLEKQIREIESSQSHHMSRKAPLPPLKDV
ncbi:hypothetical protein M9Y10_038697 [Tritrichomonas musculus]|uniref:Uncharacterized protein n=1 Tax=Tritrichomonas musculus TaxID=1915356 RepID=A0ABR2K975_9EUKA